MFSSDFFLGLAAGGILVGAIEVIIVNKTLKDVIEVLRCSTNLIKAFSEALKIHAKD